MEEEEKKRFFEFEFSVKSNENRSRNERHFNLIAARCLTAGGPAPVALFVKEFVYRLIQVPVTNRLYLALLNRHYSRQIVGRQFHLQLPVEDTGPNGALS